MNMKSWMSGVLFVCCLVLLLFFSALRVYDYKNSQSYLVNYKNNQVSFFIDEVEIKKPVPTSEQLYIKNNDKIKIWYNNKDDSFIVMDNVISYFNFYKSVIILSVLSFVSGKIFLRNLTT